MGYSMGKNIEINVLRAQAHGESSMPDVQGDCIHNYLNWSRKLKLMSIIDIIKDYVQKDAHEWI